MNNTVITVTRAEQVQAIVALALELPKDMTARDVGIDLTDGSWKNIERTMKKRGVLSILKKQSVIHLHAPHGVDSLHDISNALWERYEMVSNSHTFPKNMKDVTARFSRAILYMIRQGATIDNLDLVFRADRTGKRPTRRPEDGSDTICSEDGFLLPLGDLCDNLSRTGVYYFSSRYMKKVIVATKESEEGFLSAFSPLRLSTSRASGFLLARESAMVVYYIDNPDMAATPKSEREAKHMLSNELYIRAYGRPARNENSLRIDRGSCLLLYKTPEDIVAMWRSEVRMRLRPESYYAERFTLLTDARSDDAFWFLTQRNAEKRVLSELYSPDGQTPQYSCDAIKDGIPSWEFLTSDFGKVSKIRKATKTTELHIYCYEWQRDILRTLITGKRIHFEVLTEDRIAEIKESMKSDPEYYEPEKVTYEPEAKRPGVNPSDKAGDSAMREIDEYLATPENDPLFGIEVPEWCYDDKEEEEEE